MPNISEFLIYELHNLPTYGEPTYAYIDKPVAEDPNPKAVYYTQPIPEPDPSKRPVSAPSEAKRAKLRARRKKKSR